LKKYKKYIERDDLDDATHLEVSVYYAKGGIQYFPSGTYVRGYYLAVKPVIKNGSIFNSIYAGRKHLLLETSCYTDKRYIQAVKMAKVIEDELIDIVAEENKTK
jgi:hypothetical protein